MQKFTANDARILNKTALIKKEAFSTNEEILYVFFRIIITCEQGESYYRMDLTRNSIYSNWKSDKVNNIINELESNDFNCVYVCNDEYEYWDIKW